MYNRIKANKFIDNYYQSSSYHNNWIIITQPGKAFRLVVRHNFLFKFLVDVDELYVKVRCLNDLKVKIASLDTCMCNLSLDTCYCHNMKKFNNLSIVFKYDDDDDDDDDDGEDDDDDDLMNFCYCTRTLLLHT
uniref:Uncharacterized protein n=1 Tax=Glossina pallidipes TaxID=7398 RepID=A0A1B0AFY5_GLOPL